MLFEPKGKMWAKLLWYCRVHHSVLAERHMPCWDGPWEKKRKHKDCGWVLAIPVEIGDELSALRIGACRCLK